jgi:hypothetical protein
MFGIVFMLLFAANPAPARVYPQKFRTFYSSNDEHLPSTLKMGKFPVPAITATARSSDGAIWIGSEHGLIRYDSRAGPVDQIQYFAGLRYLPDDHVVAITPDLRGGVWVRTSTAAAHIELKPMTLAAKAAYFEQRVLARHDRHGLVDRHLRGGGMLSIRRNHEQGCVGAGGAFHQGGSFPGTCYGAARFSGAILRIEGRGPAGGWRVA